MTSKQLIIGLVGLKGCGKGTVAKILREKYRADVHRYSDIMRDVLARIYVDHSRENLVAVSSALRHAFGEGIFQRAMLRDVAASASSILVLDGIRRVEELDGLSELKNFHLVSIDAPLEIRYQRSANRGENVGEHGMTLEQFAATETASTEITIPEVQVHATEHLQNDGTLEELNERIDALMKTFLK